MSTVYHNLSSIILAAGKGTRMQSTIPKVLHQIGSKSMLQHVVDTVQQLSVDNIYIVYGHGKSFIEQAMQDQPVSLIYQSEQLGTGHAVRQAIAYIKDDEDILILYGDTPLITADSLKKLITIKPKKGIALLTVMLDNPTGYGRIERKNGRVTGIIEQKDATLEQLAINEINTGIMLVTGYLLKKWLMQLNNNNTQKEFYLTDIIALAHNDGYDIVTANPDHLFEAQGVNDRLQLAKLERQYQYQQAEKLLLAGVTLLDPNRFDLRGSLTCGIDVIFDSNVIIEGNVKLGNHVHIGTGCVLTDCEIGDYTVISPYSVITDSILERGCTVGPFARLRPGTQLAENVHVGNFVEIKKSALGKNTKAGHLTYLGDSDIGDNVNVGAGVITCNYDGANKHKTVIEDNVFVGSDTQLIAPVRVKKGATIAAGTTVTKDVNENDLVISRMKQKQVMGWVRPEKKNNR